VGKSPVYVIATTHAEAVRLAEQGASAEGIDFSDLIDHILHLGSQHTGATETPEKGMTPFGLKATAR
jgi:hypothetical protein